MSWKETFLGLPNSFKNLTNCKTIKKIEKNLPDIMVVGGIILNGLAIYQTVKSTEKASKILKEKDERLNKVQEALDRDDISEEEYSEEDAKNDITKIKVQTVIKLVEEAAKPCGLYVAGTALILGGYFEEKKRYIVAAGLATTINQTFKDYRQRVRDEEGTEKDLHYMYGTEEHEEVTTETDEEGKKVKHKETVSEIVGEVDGMSPYSVIWGERFIDGRKNPHWDKNKNFNLSFLKIQESIANDILNRRGYIFLNEVRESIGLKATPYGAIVGWKKGNGDNFVDFGIYHNERDSIKRMFNNENVFVLDFNVDGPIYDLL